MSSNKSTVQTRSQTRSLSTRPAATKTSAASASAAPKTPAAKAKTQRKKPATSKRKGKRGGTKPSSAAGSTPAAAAVPPAEADVLPDEVPLTPRFVAPGSDAADLDGGNGNAPAAGFHMVPVTTPQMRRTGGHAGENPTSGAVNVPELAGFLDGMQINTSQQLGQVLTLTDRFEGELRNTNRNVANLKSQLERYAETNGQRWARNDIQMAEMKRQMDALTPKKPH